MSIYVMSDIHGLASRFEAMLQKIQIQEEDHVYILGDIIDRGKDGIKILQKIMNEKYFTLILGNHELMMLEYYEDLKQKEQNDEYRERWARNGCEPTMAAFEALTPREQEELLAYIKKSPLAISDVIVKDRFFYLVHGAPVTSLRSGAAYLHSDFIKLFPAHDFVWNRMSKECIPFEDRTVIIGHTITSFYQSEHPYAVWSDHKDLTKAKLIDIDCGCACNDKYTQLACIRLDDMKVYYV